VSKCVRVAVIGLYAAMWAGAVIGFIIFRQPPPEVTWAGVLYVAASLGLAVLYSDASGRAFFALAGILGFLSELSGMHLGIPFGNYSYTHILGPQLFGVPLTIGIAWALFAAYARWHTRWLAVAWQRVLAGALCLVCIDLLVDPLSAGPLGFWTWHVDGAYLGVPAGNFWGWFAVGLLVFTVAQLLHLPAMARSGRLTDGVAYVGLGNVLVYTVTAMAEGMYIPALIGVLLVAAHLASASAERKLNQRAIEVVPDLAAAGHGGYSVSLNAANGQSQPEAD
jgi:bisanhydrobacterioruberin hydratase